MSIMLRRFKLSPSRQVILFIGSFCLGIFIGAGLSFRNEILVLAEGAAGLFLVGFLFWKTKPVRILSFVLALGVLGFVFSNFYRTKIGGESFDFAQDKMGKAILGEVVSDPEKRLKDQRMVLKISTPQELKNRRVWLVASYDKELFFGDQVQAEGKISFPQKIDKFDYPNFLLARHKTALLLEARQIEILQRDQGSKVLATLFKVKRGFKETIEKAVKEPESSLLVGLIIGGQPDMPETLKDKFNRTGTSHILAVSGYNLAIISVVLFRWLRRLSFRLAIWLTSFMILAFMLITGLEPGVVRAGILTYFYFLGKVLGRPVTPIILLFWVGCLMLLFNPLSIRFDPSFSLSFLAVLGLFYLTPLFEKWFSKLRPWPKLLPEIKEATTATFGAITATLPLILVLFGRVSLIAPFANLLVVPLVPVLMLLGFLIGGLGLILGGLGAALGLLGFGLGHLILTIIDWLSRLPFASVSLPASLNWLLYIGVLFLIVIGWMIIKVKTQKAKVKGAS